MVTNELARRYVCIAFMSEITINIEHLKQSNIHQIHLKNQSSSGDVREYVSVFRWTKLLINILYVEIIISNNNNNNTSLSYHSF